MTIGEFLEAVEAHNRAHKPEGEAAPVSDEFRSFMQREFQVH